ncbi:MAG: Maf family protein [Armatimonadota bacterium]
MQGRGALLVQEVRGCYFNVVGLPLVRLAGMLARLGIRPLQMGTESA